MKNIFGHHLWTDPCELVSPLHIQNANYTSSSVFTGVTFQGYQRKFALTRIVPCVHLTRIREHTTTEDEVHTVQ